MPLRNNADFQELSQCLAQARTLEEIAAPICRLGRRIMEADGISFVVRDHESCWYLDENAIAPLWRGKRFPLESCISGWVMQHRQQVIIPDIRIDPRIPQELYRRTFVRSMMMNPVHAPTCAAIGAYWAEYHDPSDIQQVALHELARVVEQSLAALPA